MNSEELDDLRAARDEARLAIDAIDSAIESAEAIAEDEQASAVILFRGEAERHLRSALSKLKPEGAAKKGGKK